MILTCGHSRRPQHDRNGHRRHYIPHDSCQPGGREELVLLDQNSTAALTSSSPLNPVAFCLSLLASPFRSAVARVGFIIRPPGGFRRTHDDHASSSKSATCLGFALRVPKRSPRRLASYTHNGAKAPGSSRPSESPRSPRSGGRPRPRASTTYRAWKAPSAPLVRAPRLGRGHHHISRACRDDLDPATVPMNFHVHAMGSRHETAAPWELEGVIEFRTPCRGRADHRMVFHAK